MAFEHSGPISSTPTLGRLADEHAEPQRGALVTGVDGDGAVSVGELPDCGGGGGCGHESFVSIPPVVCKAKVVSSVGVGIRFMPNPRTCESGPRMSAASSTCAPQDACTGPLAAGLALRFLPPV